MSSISKYQILALDWKPENNSSKPFMLIVTIVTFFLLSIAFTLSSIDLPEPERLTIPHVPDRIARFIVQKQRIKALKPKLKTVRKPLPMPIPKPRLKKHKIKKTQQQKPLTKSQKIARKIAETSGLLALSNELESLKETDDIAATLNGNVPNSSPGSFKASNVNTEILTAGINAGSGGVSDKLITSNISHTRLTKAERSSIKQTLLAREITTNSQSKNFRPGEGRSESANIRDDEDVTIIFDQNKSKLYSLYSRARRKNPGLKGKIVFQLTISASGKVVDINILSSEFNDPALENSMLSRIKLFNFGAINTETLVVTYPVEFLPAY